MYRKMVLLVVLLLLSTGMLCAQEGYRIAFSVANISDTVCYLANYYGDKTYLADTAMVKEGGLMVFEGKSPLPEGIYILAGQSNNRYLELIVDHEQHFSVVAQGHALPFNVSFEGSEVNHDFYTYIQYNLSLAHKTDSISSLAKKVSDPDSLLMLQQMADSLNSLTVQYKLDYIEKHPGSFLTSIFKAMKEPDREKANESGAPFDYMIHHYWDDFDLTDERMLRTPLFHKKMDTYFNKIVYQHPDSIIAAADRIINQVRGNSELFKFTVWYMTFKYETSKIMGFDEIFVHMIDNYYAKGEAFWADSVIVTALMKRAGDLRPVLIGARAPELILIDTLGDFVSLHQTEAPYLLLIFYETDCGHCKTEIEEIRQWYEADTLGVEVFAVCTDTSLTKWKTYIRENSPDWINVNGTRSITQAYHKLYNISTSPTLFLLDRNKRIIAKRIRTDQLIPFLSEYHQRNTEQRE